MKRMRLPNSGVKLGTYRRQLNVIEFIATRRGDPERGPLVRMRGSEARIRLLSDGELVWVEGPRRKEIAVLEIDESVPDGRVVLRDIAGVAVSEYVNVTKPDLDTPAEKRQVG